VIDGANGTEIQRRGGKPAETFSSGTSALARPDICQEVHEAYLEAGADIIITHSYSSNRNVMTPSGNGDRTCECILACAAIARRATTVHVAKYASKLAHAAAAANAQAAQAVESAAMSAARLTTSETSNQTAATLANAAVEATALAELCTDRARRAMLEVQACAAAAKAAAEVARDASEGEPLHSAAPPLSAPPPVPTKGWDAAGFGPAIVVGTLSSHPPEMPAGGESSASAKWPEPKLEEEAYLEAATAHGLSGVDLLFLEMMKDSAHAKRVVKASVSSGLPIMMGISARTDQETGKLVLWGTGDDAIPLTKEWFFSLADILGPSLVGVNVMHTNFSTTAGVLKFLREECKWEGALGAYPDHGVFKAPEWVFAELDNASALTYVEEWITKYNVQLVGGCCGLSPEYIKVLHLNI